MNQNALASKKAAVKEICDGLKENATLVVVSYQGFTVAEMSELRHKLAEKDSRLGVYKNTLVAKALKESNISGLDDILNGPNALVFSKTETGALALLRKFARQHENMKLRGGLVDGTPVDEKTLLELSKLPDKNGMYSMFLSCLNAPITKFAATIKALADKQGAAA